MKTIKSSEVVDLIRKVPYLRTHIEKLIQDLEQYKKTNFLENNEWCEKDLEVLNKVLKVLKHEIEVR